MENNDNSQPKDRVNVILLTGSLCSVTVVLAITPVLTSSRDLQPHTTHSLLFGWETIVYFLSILALVMLLCLKNDDNHYEYVNNHRNITRDPLVDGGAMSWWTSIPAQSTFLITLCIGSLVFPGFEFTRAIENLCCFENQPGWLTAFCTLTVCRSVGCIIFCFLQLVFLLKRRFYVIRYRLPKYIYSVTLAANLSLCVDVILATFYTSDTMALYNKIEDSSVNNISTDLISEQAVYFKCENSTAKPDNVIFYFFKYSYQYRIEYALLSLCFIFPIWNIHKRPRQARQVEEPDVLTNSTNAASQHSRSASVSSDGTPPGSVRDDMRRRIKSRIKLTFLFVAKHAFIPSVAMAIGIFAAHLYTNVYNNYIEPDAQVVRYFSDNNTMATEWNSTIQTVYTYTICIVAFIGWILVRSEITERKQFTTVDAILLVGTFGHLLLILFETIDSMELFVSGQHEKGVTTKVFFLVKTILHYVGLYSQVILILKATHIKVCQDIHGKTKQTLIKGIVVFIGVCNVEKWMVDNFLTPVALNYAEAIDFQEVYGQVIWWNVVELSYPFVAVYRLASAIMCFEATVRFKQSGL